VNAAGETVAATVATAVAATLSVVCRLQQLHHMLARLIINTYSL